jgi:hypothetical protein
LNNQRATKSIMDQRAQYVIDKMQDVYNSQPTMTTNGHQIKAMVVLPSMQAVYDFAQLLKARAKGRRTASGNPFCIGAFFSGRVEKKGKVKGEEKWISEYEANDGVGVVDCDIIVTCRKYVTGYDEWRVCAVFLATRLQQPEFLQQVLGRAMRARPGDGKRRPLVFDIANNPDSIFKSVMRFWNTTVHHPEALGELKVLTEEIFRYSGMRKDNVEASVFAAQRLPNCDKVLLRAAIVSYWQAVARVSNTETPIPFQWLYAMLESLNLELKKELFGGSEILAKKAAEFVASGQEPMSASSSGGGKVNASAVCRTVPGALKVLRKSLELGRRKRVRRDPEAQTPLKKPRLAADVEKENEGNREIEDDRVTPEKGQAPQVQVQATPGVSNEKQPSDPAKEAQLISEGLEEAVEDMVVKYKKKLPKSGDYETPDTRDIELERFDYASAPLKAFNAKLVQVARKKLVSKLAVAYGEVVKPWLEAQKHNLEVDFLKEFVHYESRQIAVNELASVCDSFVELASTVGPCRVTGSLRSGLRRKLTRKIHERFGPADGALDTSA